MGIDSKRKAIDNSNRKKHFFPEPGMIIDLGTLLEKQVVKYGNNPFLTSVDTGASYTYHEFNHMVNRTAHGLSDLDISKGDYVAVMLPNCCEYLFICYSLYKLGVVDVAINTEFRGIQLTRLINMTKTKFLVCDEPYIDMIADIANNLDYLETIIFINGADRAKEKLTKFKVLDYQNVLSDNISNPASVVNDDTDVAMVLPTSGTTGFSKGCMLSHRACIRVGENAMLFLELSEKDIAYEFFPLFHCGSRLYHVLSIIMVGGCVALRSKFSLSNFWADVVKYKCTFFITLGSVQTLLYNAPPKPEETEHNLRIVWCAPTTVPKELWEERFKVELITRGGYSETAVGSVVAPQRGHDGGIVRSIYDVRIFDENDEELTDGKIGEMVIRPLEPDIMFKGFYDMEEATLKTWKNLWHHTGDLGYYDEEGYFYYMGRNSERIRVRGEMVSAFEVEDIFSRHQHINECAAIGVTSDLGEDDVKLYVKLNSEVDVNEGKLIKELLDYGNKNMAKYMVPKYFTFIKDLPKTPSGKVKKKSLLKLHKEETAAQNRTELKIE